VRTWPDDVQHRWQRLLEKFASCTSSLPSLIHTSPFCTKWHYIGKAFEKQLTIQLANVAVAAWSGAIWRMRETAVFLIDLGIQEHTWFRPSASLWTGHITKELRYGTRFQWITQFYLPPTALSTNGMNHTCLCLPSRSWSSFTDPVGMEDWVGHGTMVSKLSFSQGCRGDLTSILIPHRKTRGNPHKILTLTELATRLVHPKPSAVPKFKAGHVT